MNAELVNNLGSLRVLEYRVSRNDVLKLNAEEIIGFLPIKLMGGSNGRLTLDCPIIYYSPFENYIGEDEFFIAFKTDNGDDVVTKILVDVVATFKPKAHVLILLGEELIKSPVMAIYELIKNSYDADSSDISVSFDNIESIENAQITITDFGTGLTKEVLENVWFEPGTDFRKPINSDGTRQIKRSPIFGRIPMGEKGVGRFAVHKLGNTIKMITRPAKVKVDEYGKAQSISLLDYELVVDIDWRTFSQSRYLEDVKINWIVNNDPISFFFKHTHGTKIIIGSLKETWTRGMARQLKRQTISMLSPKNDPNKFQIKLDFGNWWLKDFPSIEEIFTCAPYKLNVLIDDKFEMTFEYNFNLSNNSKIGSRSINGLTTDTLDRSKHIYNIKGGLKPFYRQYLENKEYTQDEISLLLSEYDSEINKLPFGALMLEMYSYDLDSASIRDYSNTLAFVRSVLREHAGIKVFRKDMRVFDYGDPGNDWLGLDIKRINNKSWFSNNQNIGFIYLDDEKSGSLIEKTNREGFINNKAYDFFIVLLEYILTAFKSERSSDRERWLKFNKKGDEGTLEQQLDGFKTIIQNTDLNDDQKKQELIKEAENIEERYSKDKETLLIPAGIGMTASFAMHEIEKLVPRMEETVHSKPIDENRITDQVNELKDYVEGILSVLKKGGSKPISLIESINQAVKNYSTRLKSWNIKVEIDHENTIQNIICDKRLLVTMLMNLIDNSIYWLDTIYKNEKSILIKTYQIDGGISILIIDNGPGFKDKIEDIVRPFFSRKEGGIGIGMYLIDTVMIQYGRLNIIYDRDYLSDLGIPEKYDGAAVELIFKKKI